MWGAVSEDLLLRLVARKVASADSTRIVWAILGGSVQMQTRFKARQCLTAEPDQVVVEVLSERDGCPAGS